MSVELARELRRIATFLGAVKRWLGRWYGVLLTAAFAVSGLWLTFTGRHTLYVHPRYTVFIIEMSALAVVACVWGFWQSAAFVQVGQAEHQECCGHSAIKNGDGTGGHVAGHKVAGTPRRQWQARIGKMTTTILVIIAAIMVLIVPPAPLSPNMVAQRSVGVNTGRTNSSNIVRSLADLPAEPRISDWAMLLMSKTSDDLTGVPASVEGFVTTTPEIADRGYYLVRFTIICCAVDAFPAQVPVYDPAWRERVEVGQWLKVSGSFQPVGTALAGEGLGALGPAVQGGSDQAGVGGLNGESDSENADSRTGDPAAAGEGKSGILEDYMLHPTEVTPIPEPAEPYLY